MIVDKGRRKRRDPYFTFIGMVLLIIMPTLSKTFMIVKMYSL